MAELYCVITKYKGHPVLGDWESRTRRPMTRAKAEEYAAHKAQMLKPDPERNGFLKSIEVRSLDALEGLSFEDGAMTVEFFEETSMSLPWIEIQIDSGRNLEYRDGYEEPTVAEYSLDMDEAERMHKFLGEALERAGRSE